ncbi:hypothetical protein [Runella slithyformis]|uniref:hypothetical protein n=1 Tax=Runella slithyformis TaxID=106 RepID=UPI0014699EF0|nr:hypothetical protein [Runella slithyformis]
MKNNPNAVWEVYDLTTDLGEQNNLAAQHPEFIPQFEAIVKREHRPSHLQEWEFVDPKFEVKK